jgi:hypothetical protein
MELWIDLRIFLTILLHVIVYLVPKLLICNLNLENTLFTIENLISLAVSPFRQIEIECVLFLKKNRVYVTPIWFGAKPCQSFRFVFLV